MTEDQTMVSTPMPQYECHKVVSALKIKSIEFDTDLAQKENRETDGSAILSFEEGRFADIKVSRDFVSRIKSDAEMSDKGYYIVYRGGYKSWSPTKVFEEGYRKIG